MDTRAHIRDLQVRFATEYPIIELPYCLNILGRFIINDRLLIFSWLQRLEMNFLYVHAPDLRAVTRHYTHIYSVANAVLL